MMPLATCRQVVDIITNAHGLGYNIQIVYPFVARDELLKRVRRRNEKVCPHLSTAVHSSI